MTNPYRPAAPSSDELTAVYSPETSYPSSKSWFQFVALIATVIVIAVYYYVMLRRIPTAARVPLWPTLTLPVVVSIFSAIGSRSLLLPPMTAIAGVFSGSVVFGFMRSWPAAELPIALGLGFFLAIPSFLLCLWSRKRHRKRQYGEQPGPSSGGSITSAEVSAPEHGGV